MPINESWEKIFQSRTWGMRPNDALVNLIDQWKPEKVLEVGCGMGANLMYMAGYDIEIHGIDGAPTGIMRAQQFLDEHYPNWKGSLKVGDIADLSYKANTFDFVLDVEAISANSYEDAKKIYKEIVRVLKPGGRMLSVTFATDTWTGKMAPGVETRLSTENDLKSLLHCFGNYRFFKRTSQLVDDPRPDHHLKQWIIEAIK